MHWAPCSSHIISSKIPMKWNLHFTDVGPEAQRNKIACLKIGREVHIHTSSIANSFVITGSLAFLVKKKKIWFKETYRAKTLLLFLTQQCKKWTTEKTLKHSLPSFKRLSNYPNAYSESTKRRNFKPHGTVTEYHAQWC